MANRVFVAWQILGASLLGAASGGCTGMIPEASGEELAAPPGEPSSGSGTSPAAPGAPSSSTPGVAPPPAGAGKFRCAAPDARGIGRNGTRRLDASELGLTVRSLFGAEIFGKVRDAVNRYPGDNLGESVAEFDPRLRFGHADALEAVAFAVPAALLAERRLAETQVPPCLFKDGAAVDFVLSNGGCNLSFVKALGSKIHRRPLSDEEAGVYAKLLTDPDPAISFATDRVAAVISSMMLGPNFSLLLTHLEDAAGARSRVDPFTLASRLSYAAAGTMPDDALFAAAAARQLATAEQRRPHAERLLGSALARQHIRQLFTGYMRLGAVSTPSAQYGTYLGISTAGLVDALRQEALDFAEHIVYEQKGTFRDLLLSPLAFPRTANVAKLLKTDGVSTGVKDPRTAGDGRKGMFMRPVWMLAPEPRTSPIHRGYTFGTRAVCLSLPPPDPASLTIGEKLASEVDPLKVSASEEAEYVTGPATCRGCHVHINPPGHAFERFGALGEVRTQEAIFDAGGKLLRKLPIAASTTVRLDGEDHRVTSADELVSLVAGSTQGQACIAQQVYRFTRLAEEEASNECHLAELEGAVRGGESVLAVLARNAASEDLAWQKREEP